MKNAKKRLINIIIKKEEILNFICNWSEAIKELKTVIKIANELKDYKKVAMFEYKSAIILQKIGETEDAMGLLDKTYRFCEKNNLNLEKLLVSERTNYFQGNFNKAIEDNEKIINLINKNHLNKRKSLQKKRLELLDDALKNLGVIVFYQSKYEKALEYFLEKLEIDKKLKNKRKISTSYTNIGSCYAQLENYDKAKKYLLAKAEMSNQLGDKRGLSFSYVNLGNIYGMLGDFDKSIKFYYKALKIAEELNDKDSLSVVYSNIGILYLNNCSFEKASVYLDKYLNISKENNNIREIGFAYFSLGQVYMELKQYKKSIVVFTKAEVIFKKIGDIKNLLSLYFMISDIYYCLAKYKKAQKYLDLYMRINKQDPNIEIKKYRYELLNLKIKYRKEKKILINKIIELSKQYSKDIERAEIYFQIYDIGKSLKFFQDRVNSYFSKAYKLYSKLNKVNYNYFYLSRYKILEEVNKGKKLSSPQIQ